MLSLKSGGYGITKYQLRGRNASVSTTSQTLWIVGGNYARLSSGTALEVISSSANDAAAGTGARTVVVQGVDANYEKFTETVTLNGTNAVALANTSVLGINKFYVATTGSGLVNAGTIDVRTVSGATVKTRINSGVDAGVGLGIAADFLFTVPAGHNALLREVFVSSISVTGGLTAWIVTHNSSGVQYQQGSGCYWVSPSGVGVGSLGQTRIHFGEGLIIPEKTLIECRVDATAGTPEVTAMADLFLFNDDLNPLYFGAG